MAVTKTTVADRLIPCIIGCIIMNGGFIHTVFNRFERCGYILSYTVNILTKNMKKPRCCDKPMLRAEARVRNEGDERLTSSIPRQPVGWYCKYCKNFKGQVVHEEWPLL